MKSLIRKAVQKLSTWPVIGRFVRTVVAIIRLPAVKQRQHELDTVQLPALTEKVARLENALNELKADLTELNSGVEAINTDIPAINTEMPEIKSALDDLKAWSSQIDNEKDSLESEVSSHTNAIHAIDAQRPFQKNLVGSAPIAFRNIVRDIRGLKQDLGAISGTVNYLDNRIEFVRQELMYEMRYGSSSPVSQNDERKVKTDILSPEKLESAANGQVRVNLGCGHKPLEDYLNVDRRALPGVDIVAEVDDLPFKQGEVDEIFSAHLLEHFPQEQLKRVLLKYWYSLLKPGGEFRAIVPDGDGMIQAYSNGEYPFENLRLVTYGAQDYDGDFHFNMFTPSSLSELLLEAGFTDPRIIAANRENKGCKEFEITSRRT